MGLDDGKVLITGVLIFIIALAGSFIFGNNVGASAEVKDPDWPWEDMDKLESEMTIIEDYAAGDAEWTCTHNITDPNVCNVSVILTWTDEDDTGWIGMAPNHENKPDEFSIKLTGPHGSVSGSESGSNEHGQEGRVELTIGVPTPTVPSTNGTGDWNIVITVNAGDHEPKRIGAFKFSDSGNDFKLEITHEFYSKP